jgi:hypothetical protein
MDFENSKKLSPEEMAKIEKQRTISDAELLKNGADYKFDNKGNKRIINVDVEGNYIEDAKQEAIRDQFPYDLEAPKTINEQRRDFVNEQLKSAGKLIEMQKFTSDEEKTKAIEKLKNSAANLFDSWAANIRAGVTADDMKFLKKADNPYNYMGMSAEEKMRLYDLQDRIKSAKEGIEQEKLLDYLSSEDENWYVGAKKNPDGTWDLSRSAKFNPKEKNSNAEQKQPLEKKEKLEGEKLFQYQIENNSHPNARALQKDMIMLIGDIDRGNLDLDYLKESLSETLNRNDIEYSDNGDNRIDEKDKEILQPIMDFRNELDHLNTFTEQRLADFRKRIREYLTDTFGIEISDPKEGDDFDRKSMAAIKAEETKNSLLDYKIKKVFSSGYEINDKLFDYYKKWYNEKDKELRRKWNSIKKDFSSQEFDRVYDEDSKWLKQHSFSKSVRPARVEVYKYKA